MILPTEQQYTNREISKELHELGLRCETQYYHARFLHQNKRKQKWILELKENIYHRHYEIYPALSVAELGVLLPFEIKYKNHPYYLEFLRYPHYHPSHNLFGYKFYNACLNKCLHYEESLLEVTARAKMLLHLLKTNSQVREELKKKGWLV